MLTAYAMALLSIAVLYLAGASLGVSLAASDWLKMTGLMLVGLIPFAALGIALGHMLTPDSIGPAMGGGVSLFALLGGTWFPLGNRLPVRPRAVRAVLLARAGQPRRARRQGLDGHGVVRDRSVDGGAQRARAARLPPRHSARVGATFSPIRH